MDILKKTILFSLPLLLTGCYEDFDPHIDTTPVLCLNSLITPGNPIEVQITRTWVFTDEEGEKNHSVDDAVLEIYANGKIVGSDYIPAEGDLIRLVATSKKYGEAEAEVKVPIATQIGDVAFTPNVESISVEEYPGRGIYARTLFDVLVSLGLDASDDTLRFYQFDYASFHPNDILTDENASYHNYDPTYTHFYSGEFEPLDAVFYEQANAFDEVLNYGYRNLFFSDRLLNKESNALDFAFLGCSFDISNWTGNKEKLVCGWKITLHSISESYYKWLTYCWQSDSAVLGDIADVGLADPAWGYSNVSTGAGVVAAQSSTTVTINLQDFLYDYISKECK